MYPMNRLTLLDYVLPVAENPRRRSLSTISRLLGFGTKEGPPSMLTVTTFFVVHAPNDDGENGWVHRAEQRTSSRV